MNRVNFHYLVSTFPTAWLPSFVLLNSRSNSDCHWFSSTYCWLTFHIFRTL